MKNNRAVEVGAGEQRRWFLLGVATVAQVGVAVIRLGITALIPLIRQDLALDRTQVGLVSSILNTGAAAAGIPAGKAVDRYGERLVIGYGAIASGVVILAVCAVSNFALFVPILILTGLLTTTSVPAGGKVVAGWFRDRERATAMGIRQTGVPLGGAIAALTLPPLALLTDWRIALSLAGIGVILIGAAALYLYREPGDAQRVAKAKSNAGVKSLLARADIRALLLYGFLFGAAQWCYLTYLTLFLIEAINLSVVVAGTLLAVGQICGALGRIGWGLVSDRIFNGRRRPALFTVGLLAIAMTVSMALMSPSTSLFLIAVVVSLLGLSLQGWNGLTHTLASELAGADIAGVAVGMINSVGFLGVMLLPPVFGLVVDHSQSYGAAWLMLVFLIAAALCGLGAIHESGAREART